jgi:hypothetical protein
MFFSITRQYSLTYARFYNNLKSYELYPSEYQKTFSQGKPSCLMYGLKEILSFFQGHIFQFRTYSILFQNNLDLSMR